MDLNAIINLEELSGFDRQEVTGVTAVWPQVTLFTPHLHCALTRSTSGTPAGSASPSPAPGSASNDKNIFITFIKGAKTSGLFQLIKLRRNQHDTFFINYLNFSVKFRLFFSPSQTLGGQHP